MASNARTLVVGAALYVTMSTRAISDKPFKTGSTRRSSLFFECAHHDTARSVLEMTHRVYHFLGAKRE
jgi:hypothetical protein